VIGAADDAATLGMMRREILELVRRDADALADIKASLDRIGCRLGRIEQHIDGIDCITDGLVGFVPRVDALVHEIDGFRRDLSRIIGEAVREAFREERERKR